MKVKRTRARGRDIRLPQGWAWWEGIARELIKSARIARGSHIIRTVEKKRTDGRSDVSGYSVVGRDPRDLAGLGKALLRMCAGEDARAVFEQLPGKLRLIKTTGKDGSTTLQFSPGVGRPLRDREMNQRALLYWKRRVAGDSQDEAARVACTKVGFKTAPPAARTLIKFAGPLKDRILASIELRTTTISADGSTSITRRGPATDRLLAAAKRRSRRKYSA